jgi:hypothetical protein
MESTSDYLVKARGATAVEAAFFFGGAPFARRVGPPVKAPPIVFDAAPGVKVVTK